jgi:polysaccharide export outer membrane protein
MKRFLQIFIVVVMTVWFSACGINTNLMFKTPKDFAYDSIPMRPKYDYRISPNDKIELELYTNNGGKLIDFYSGGNTEGMVNGGSSSLNYLVRTDSLVELPIVGDVKIVGLTIKQCQDTLKQIYARYYQEPFVQVRVINKRVIVFPGSGADAKVVPLLNNNTTLMEVVALAGGIAERGRASKVKLMRNVDNRREVYLIDLSTIDGLFYADMIVQSNDYIYIEPQPQVGKELLKQIVPIISLISSTAVIITVFYRLK